MNAPIPRLLAGALPLLLLPAATRAEIASPLDIPGHVLWLDGDDVDGNGATDTFDDGFLLGDWVDKSAGQGVNTVVVTAGAPSVATNAIGTRRAVHFRVGSEDKMDNETFTVAADYTVFTVVQVDSSAGSGHVLSGLNTAGTDTVLYRAATNLRFYSGQATGNTDVLISPLADPLRPFLLGYQISSTGADRGFFQKTTTSFESNGPADLQGIRVGNLDRDTPSSTARSEGFGGVIAQVIVYERALSDTEIADVVAYLDTRFGLTSTPGGGPIASPLELDGHVLWLDGDDVNGDGTKDTGENGAAITEWVDKSSGQGVNSAVLTGGSPTRQFNVVGTHHAVNFAGGTEDKLDSAGLVVGENYAVFTVVQPNDTSVSGHVLSGVNGDATDPVLYRSGGGSFRFYSGVTTGNTDVGFAQRLGAQNFLLFGYQINATGSDIGFYKDQRILFEGQGPATLDGVRIGNLDRDTPSSTMRAEAFDGQIAEVVIYGRTLTPTELQQVYDYFNTKYGLETLRPHPEATGAMAEVETGQVTGGSPSTLDPASEPVTTGRTNVALAAHGGTAFSQDYIGPGNPRDFRAYRANDGFYADPPEGAPPVDEPWIAATASSFLGVKFAAPTTIDRLGFENQFLNRRQAVLFFEYTRDDLSDVPEDPDLGLFPEGVAGKTWTVIDVLEIDDAEDTRHLYRFPAIASVTAVRVRIQSTAAEFAITELEAWAAPAAPASDFRIVQFERTAPTTVSLVWTSEAGARYRFETSTTLAPAWQTVLEAGVPKEVVATGPSSQTTLPLDPSAEPQTFVRVRRMP
jgi:hypothetical protein